MADRRAAGVPSKGQRRRRGLIFKAFLRDIMKLISQYRSVELNGLLGHAREIGVPVGRLINTSIEARKVGVTENDYGVITPLQLAIIRWEVTSRRSKPTYEDRREIRLIINLLLRHPVYGGALVTNEVLNEFEGVRDRAGKEEEAAAVVEDWQDLENLIVPTHAEYDDLHQYLNELRIEAATRAAKMSKARERRQIILALGKSSTPFPDCRDCLISSSEIILIWKEGTKRLEKSKE